MTRGRINAHASVPDTGASKVSANVIVVWDDAAPLVDLEAAIKEAARKAIYRVRTVHGAASVPEGQLTIPYNALPLLPRES